MHSRTSAQTLQTSCRARWWWWWGDDLGLTVIESILRISNYSTVKWDHQTLELRSKNWLNLFLKFCIGLFYIHSERTMQKKVGPFQFEVYFHLYICTQTPYKNIHFIIICRSEESSKKKAWNVIKLRGKGLIYAAHLQIIYILKCVM